MHCAEPSSLALLPPHGIGRNKAAQIVQHAARRWQHARAVRTAATNLLTVMRKLPMNATTTIVAHLDRVMSCRFDEVRESLGTKAEQLREVSDARGKSARAPRSHMDRAVAVTTWGRRRYCRPASSRNARGERSSDPRMRDQRPQ